MKTKIITCLALAMLFFTASQLRCQNLLYDGDFSLTTEILPLNTPEPLNIWYTWLNYDYGTSGDAIIVDGACHYQIYYAGVNTYDVQLAQWGFTLVEGHAYRLSFKVKADEDRPFGVFLGENMGNWTNLNPEYDQWATTSWETISINFRASRVFDLHKLSFEMGGVNTNIYFDDIVLEDLGESPISIGIIGTAVNGWEVDVDMFTTDEIHFSLSDYPLKTGLIKFRQDNNWFLDWGNLAFPEGVAEPNAQASPINYGNYNISFNLETLEYSFQCTGDCPTSIGLIGDAVPPYNDWENDTKMLTYDGINYTILNYAFTDGEAKFRKDNDMEQLWGSGEFPSGTAQDDGPAIPVAAGLYTVTFNNITGDYSFAFPSIGIIGETLLGWDEDVDMETVDGVNFTLSEYPFNDGYVKFRLDNSWTINWGGEEFPAGVATLYGPGTFVPAGIYNVTFNQLTLEYKFTSTTCSIPEIQCPSDTYVANDPGICGATVYYEDVEASPSCGGDGIVIEQLEGLPSGSVFPIGSTYNSFLLTNAEGNTATCGFMVHVYDTEPLCPWDIYTESEPGMCGAIVEYPDINTNCLGEVISIEQVEGLPSGSLFPIGQTYNAFEITNAEGTITTCGFTVYVYDPQPLCPWDIYIESEPGLCGAIVNYPDINTHCLGEVISIEEIEGLPSGSFFPIGPTYNTFEITYADGNTTWCSFIVYVYNTVPLMITDLKEDWEPLWPPNHKMVNIFMDYSVSSVCGEVYTDIYVHSNEPEDGTGDGDTSPDWEIVDDHNVLLRAERSATSIGREYLINIFVHDESWNYDWRQIIIKVPHDSGNLTKKGAWNRTETLSTEVLSPEKYISLNTRVWPNPSTREFNLEINSSSDESVYMSVFDINGRLISNIENSGGKIFQFGDNLKAGMYHVLVRQGNNLEVVKVIKQP